MASSYSTQLRLELMTTGENRNTWGTLANTVFQHLEDSIAGYAAVAMGDTNYSLTTNNGSDDEARNMYIKLTGAHTATRTLTIPAVSKVYIVENATTGGYAVTVSNGTNTVSVTNGETKLIWTNGTTVSGFAIVGGSISTSSVTATSITTGTLTTTGNVELGHASDTTLSRSAAGVMAVEGNLVPSPASQATGDILYRGASSWQRLAAGSTGQVLTISGGVPAWGASIPSGTAMLFAQTSAPTGWTKSTTHDNKALRVVSGTASSGGTVDFTTAFASQSVAGTVGGTSLTEANLPSHTHTISITDPGHAHAYTNPVVGSSAGLNFDGSGTAVVDPTPNGSSTASATTGITASASSTGSGTTHTHSFTGTAIDLAVKYVDVIIATKD